MRADVGDKTAAPSLSLVRRAEIRQNSGESWDNAALTLSTTRPNASAGIPDVTTVTVDFEQPRRHLVQWRWVLLPDEASRKRVDDADRNLAQAELAAAPAPIEVQAQQAAVIASPFQAVFAVPGRSSVPNTGEAKRVQLLTEKIEPQLGIKTVAERGYECVPLRLADVAGGYAAAPGSSFAFSGWHIRGDRKLPVLSPGENTSWASGWTISSV